MHLATLLVLSLPLVPQQAVDPSGHWEGKVHLPEKDVSIAVDVASAASGWIGSMSVLQSTATNVPLDTVTMNGPSLHFTASLPIQASFDGTLSADSRSLSGSASSAQGSVPFEMTRTGDAHVTIPPKSSVLPKELEGRWEGTLDVNGKSVPVAVKLWAAPDGIARGTLISVGPPVEEIPITTVTVSGQDVQFEARAVSGIYQGTRDDSGQIVGKWMQASASLPLTLHRGTASADGKLTGR